MGTNTGIGIGIGIPFKNNALGGDKPYFPPELKARMIGVWTNYGKKNTDADRNIIKNKIPNAGGDLEILNAAYKLNSGFGEYKVDFLDWTINSPFINERTSFTFSSFNDTNNDIITVYQRVPAVVQSFKIKAKLRGRVLYRYYVNNGDTISVSYYEVKEGINILPDSADPTSVNGKVGFVLKGLSSIKVELIPNFEDAFVTDGINDIIASIKTLEEWNIGNKGITIVSMIHQINTNTNNFITTNNIRTDNKVIGRNIVSNIEKTGIYGWYKENIQSDTINVINNILGDKNDYISHSSPSTNINPINNSKFYVQGYAVENGFNEISSIAHYWTFAVLGKATEDEINLIIGNYNLDRSLKPDILCNIGKQGITNDNHADFNDKLVDYSGNGRDIQMNNLAWKGGSGIAAKPFETIKDYTIVSDEARQKLTIYNEFSYKVKSNTPNHYWTVQSIIKDNTSYQVTIITDKDCYWINMTSFTNNEGNKESIRKEYPVKANTPTQVIICGLDQFEYPEGIEPTTAVSYVNLEYAGEITVTFIPSYKGGLLLDGVNDFGKVTGLPIYKDYTVIADYERTDIGNIEGVGTSPVLSKSYTAGQGSFIMNFIASTGNSIRSYSFGAENTRNFSDLARQIFYQSKYKSQGFDITAGTGIDGDSLWLGTARDNDSRFFNGAIYSLMSFPYSMSEFLIERQLKKHKLGTLYPNMVEFRPVIKSNVLLDAKPTFVIRGTSTYLNAGDYVPENSQIWVSIKMNNIADRITKFTVNGKTIDIPENAYSEVTLQYGFPFVIDKSPQKISITIEQDENYVLFNPIINSNYDNYKLTFHLREYEKLINIGDYIPKGTYIRANLYLKNDINELVTFTFYGVNIDYAKSLVLDTAYNIRQIYNYDSPQEVNITIDEYIRFEDIVHPYPVLLRFNDENGNEVSWGGKFRVGSTITRIGYAADSNLLPNIYNIFGLLLNGNQVTSPKVIVEKTMVFKAKSAYIFDNNEPKCILSPRLLRIPNSSYKILGYIPDISGHGNHGKINNSAYASMSGANGYPYDYRNSSFWCDSVLAKVVSGELIEYFAVKNSTGFSNITSGVYKGEIKVTGVTKAISENKISRLRIYTNSTTDNELIDITQDGNYNIDIKGVGDANRVFFYAIPNNPNESIVVRLTEPIYIEQVGEYEGAYCLDGVDDFVTIPTTVGGKQVLMKVNWNSLNHVLYDQRNNAEAPFCIVAASGSIAYNQRNVGGNTYIDGILNNHILVDDLQAITHNIVLNNDYNVANSNSFIGTNYTKSIYAKMSLYDFMLFDNISTDDKIKELNEYVGIEAKVELPPYYWDTYGKTNLDADKATIQQRGVAVGDYDLTNINFAYDKMSGFGGYTLGKFTNSWSLSNNNNSISIVARNPYDITLKKLGENSDWEFNNTELKIISNPVSVKFKSDKNIRFTCDYHYYTVGGNSEGAPLEITSKDLIANEDTIITISPISQENIDKYNIDINRGYYLIYFQLSPTLEVNEEVTIEMLSLYPNGLVLDGVDDYLINENIPAFTDFTYILKRELLTNTVDTCSVFKGTKYAAGGWAFIADYYNSNSKTTGYSFGNAVSYTTNEKTIYGTKTSVNGNTIVPGPNVDELGITLGKWSSASYKKMVFYKLMLYPKTIPLLQINFLKNLMERDEIIDLNNPIFIKNE